MSGYLPGGRTTMCIPSPRVQSKYLLSLSGFSQQPKSENFFKQGELVEVGG